MYKKHWNEDGKRYMMKVHEARVDTSRVSGTTYYKVIQKIKIWEKRKYFLGWKCIYLNQWDEQFGTNLENKIHKSVRDCFVGNRPDKI
ncbi:hypothetical protein IFU39_16285 [Paenibacillus sp. CFBP 13594]|uniref:hypothetical protein n=1 Tax=Paenibacillus sp. CFBP 13594 TaxID=2774037 RepID=UPI00177B58BC|nr:hypothetical protein [Paenibacillus sp. CFBP 13594]MBD8839371.1 hypothetical protein [Paenibacillus sp. CFBP 13594]